MRTTAAIVSCGIRRLPPGGCRSPMSVRQLVQYNRRIHHQEPAVTLDHIRHHQHGKIQTSAFTQLLQGIPQRSRKSFNSYRSDTSACAIATEHFRFILLMSVVTHPSVHGWKGRRLLKGPFHRGLDRFLLQWLPQQCPTPGVRLPVGPGGRCW